MLSLDSLIPFRLPGDGNDYGPSLMVMVMRMPIMVVMMRMKRMKRMLSLDSLIAVRLPGDGNKLLLATSRPLMSVFFLRYLVSSSLSSSSSTSYRWLPDYKTLPDTSHPHLHPCHQQKQYSLSLLTKLLAYHPLTSVRVL